MKFKGTKKDDVYLGTAEDDVITGLKGDDTLGGGDGEDLIGGGAGADTLDGGDGNDVLFSGDLPKDYVPFHLLPSKYDTGTEHDTLSGGNGDDIIMAGIGDTIDGAAGYDYLVLSLLGADAGVSLSLRSLIAGKPVTVLGATVSGIEEVGYLKGSAFADVIDGRGMRDGRVSLDLGAGDDRLTVDGSWTDAFGGDGDDLLEDIGKSHAAVFAGGAGDDHLLGAGSAGGGDGDDTITTWHDAHGGAGDDVISAAGVAAISAYGEDGDDTLTGGVGHDLLYGGEGGDVLNGGDGNDILWSAGDTAVPEAKPAHDALDGGAGNDQLWAELGDDAAGGDGEDTLALTLTGVRHGVTFDSRAVESGAAVTVAGGMLSGFEHVSRLVTGDYADVVTLGGTGAHVAFDTASGNDRITVLGGNISGKAGAGDDVVILGDLTNLGGAIDGGDGADTLSFALATKGMTYDGFWRVSFTGFETISGTAYRDLFFSHGSASQHFQGAGGDDMLGTETGDDWLEGGDGNDTLSGGGGEDRLYGGNGDDTLMPGNGDAGAGDVLSGGAGNDTLTGLNLDLTLATLMGDIETIFTQSMLIMAGRQLAGVLRIEAPLVTLSEAGTADFSRITLTGTVQLNALGNRAIFGNTAVTVRGGAAGDTITSGAGADLIYGGGGDDIINAGATAGGTAGNTLYGEDGNDRLVGALGADILVGGLGADLMIGGAGDDRYLDVDAGDTVAETADGGIDTVETRVDLVLAVNVENLILTAGSAAIVGTGNAIANVITGNAQNNILDGKGGNDTLIGGLGSDTYVVGAAGDRVVERANEGNDLVQAFVSYTLGDNVERLQMMAGGLTGTGNALDNTLTGSTGADTLVGLGGADTLDGRAGADRMIGGAGADTYVVDSAGDVVVEVASDTGTDTVIAYVNYTIPDNVELLRMGAGGLTGTGNALANRLVGSDGADTLVGLGGADDLDGGAGADTMIGGADADTFHVDNAGDRIVEAAGGPGDIAIATVDYVLPAEVETLQLDGAARVGTGNDGVNLLLGTYGDDTLYGRGGTDILRGGGGNDTLAGGTGQDVLEGSGGADRFVFAPGDSGSTYQVADGIADFSQFDQDRIDLTAFGHLTFVGTAGFSGGAQVRFENFDGDTLVSIDTNGDRVADMVIGVLRTVSFTAADFILA